MTKKKKAMLLSVSLLLVALAGCVYLFYNNSASADKPSLIVSDTNADIGGEVYVSVSINKNPGISGFAIDLEYDSQMLKPMEIVQGDILNQGLFDSNLDRQANDGILKITWFDVADIKSDGELYAIKFRVLSKEKSKTPITIKYQKGFIANQLLEDVELDLVNAKVTIK